MAHLTRGGVKLAYEEAGSGPAMMVMIHGWTCDRSHFAPQAAYFSDRYRCISVDLRGHGESDKPEQAYTIEGFADDVAWMCAELGVTRAVLAGHSMGGAIALAMSAAHPELCASLVMLDPAILFAAEMQPLFAQLAASFRSPGGQAALREFGSNAFFTPASDAGLRARLLDSMGQTPLYVASSAFDSVGGFDGAERLKTVRAPVLFVEADPVYDRVGRFRELCLHGQTGKTVGSGHFHQLEVPEQINAMMDRFLVSAVPA